MTSAPIPPPHNIRWLVDLVGEDAALRLVERYGGVRLYVPKTVTAGSAIAQMTELPPETLMPLARAHGGEELKLPICREWKVRIYRSRGQAIEGIAQQLGITRSAVHRILSNSGMTTSLQMALPLCP